MNLLPEVAVLLDVFEGEPTSVRRRSAHLRDVLLRDSLVRDLRNGEWSDQLKQCLQVHDANTRKVLGALYMFFRKEGRFTPASPRLASPPGSTDEWLREACLSHRSQRLDAIVTSIRPEGDVGADPIVSCDELLDDSEPYRSAQSVRTPLTTEAYLAHLTPALDHAPAVAFIDPYLNPKSREYARFPELVLHMRHRRSKPRIELHLKCKQGEKAAVITDADTWRNEFAEWDRRFKEARVPVRVSVWDDFHNRYFYSKLLSIQAGKGFRTSNNPKERDDWSRLSTEGREELRREFEPNSSTHTRWCEFTIGV